MIKSVKFLQNTLIFLFSFLLMYILVTIALMFFPIKGTCNHTKPYNVYLYHTFTHTEIIIPIKKENRWIRHFRFENIPTRGFIAFSYADVAFMLNTPSWSDVDYFLAAKALFYPTPALIQVGKYRGIKYNECIKIPVDQVCLDKLAKSISESFKVEEGKYKSIKYPNAMQEMQYFEAKQDYTFFHTCNNWTANRLQDAGLKTPYLAPFAQQIVYAYE